MARRPCVARSGGWAGSYWGQCYYGGFEGPLRFWTKTIKILKDWTKTEKTPKTWSKTEKVRKDFIKIGKC